MNFELAFVFNSILFEKHLKINWFLQDLHARLFSTMKNNRSKRTAAQLLIDKRYSKGIYSNRTKIYKNNYECLIRNFQ